jgi:azurin
MLLASLVAVVLLSAPASPASPAVDQAKPASSARTVEITGGDDMKYNVTTIAAKPGETLRVRLVSKGTLPKVAMAHNFVLLKLTAKALEFANAAAMARATDFIPPDMKDQVLAATGLAGPGETVEVTVKVPTAPGTYNFLCTFPGHFAAGMRGTLVVK